MLAHLAPASSIAIAALIGCLVLVLAFEATNGFHDTANAVATVMMPKSYAAQEPQADDDIAETHELRCAIKQVLGTVSNSNNAVATLLLLIAEIIRLVPREDQKAFLVDMTGRI